MPEPLVIALAQLNATVGDLKGNVEAILAARAEAARGRAALVVCPELFVTGYPPEDLVLSPAFQAAAMDAVRHLAAATGDGGPALLVGSLYTHHGELYNAAYLLDEGRVLAVQPKAVLPNYGVFDEKRVFASGPLPDVMVWRGHKLGVLVCEEVWTETVPAHLASRGAGLLIVINASPYETGKREARLCACGGAVRKTNLPLIYVNQVGGQDDLVFDGGSFVLGADGVPRVQAGEFHPSLTLTEWQPGWQCAQQPIPAPMEKLESIYQAMALGLRDYVVKNGFPGILLGLSGGIDSALSAAVAVDALGAERVLGVLLPSPYTSRDSVEDAEETARLLGMRTVTVPITPAMQAFEPLLSEVFNTLPRHGLPPAAATWIEDPPVGGNLQSRLRGNILMAFSNHTGRMLLNTGNKSELAVGYTTLYGDLCGGYGVLRDVYKMTVFALAKWRNSAWVRGGLGPIGQAIPLRSISKTPTAELAPGQKDEDQLPPYHVLDPILERLVEGRKSPDEVAAEGLDRATVLRVAHMLRMSEYKRRQAPPGVKISSMHFGRERRFPLTNRFSG